jgi:hypothetical protein
MKKLSDLLVVLCLTVSVTVWSQDSLLLQTLQANHYPLQLENSGLQGPGADFLSEAAAANQFLMIGEDHGIAELPQFTAALYQHIVPHGYQYFATETGPFTAALLQEMGQRPSFLDDLRDTLTKYPWCIPFYNMLEEAEMLQDIVGERRPDQPIIWGLDQEFIGVPRLFFPKLVEQAADETGRKVLQRYQQQALQGFVTTMANKNPSSIFFYSASPEDFAQMRAALNEDAAAHRLLDELEESWEVYHQFFTREGYASNQHRAEMMKRHFWSYYQQASRVGERPKVLFKFGANHMYRGANGLNVFDIGNFVNELASQEGTGSFHMYVIGKNGTQNAYTPFSDEAAKKQLYDAKNYLDQMDVGPLLELSGNDHWSIFDLRPIRHLLFNRKIKDLDPALEKVIWSYDAFLVIPEVHASESIGSK